MLRALGSDEAVRIVTGQVCCDVCSQQCSNKDPAFSELDSLDVCKRIPCKRQRKPPAVRTVSKDRSASLKQALLEERDLHQHVQFPEVCVHVRVCVRVCVCVCVCVRACV